MTEANGESETERRAEYYYRPEVSEGVFRFVFTFQLTCFSRYLYNKVQQKRSELEASLGVRNN